MNKVSTDQLTNSELLLKTRYVEGATPLQEDVHDFDYCLCYSVCMITSYIPCVES